MRHHEPLWQILTAPRRGLLGSEVCCNLLLQKLLVKILDILRGIRAKGLCPYRDFICLGAAMPKCCRSSVEDPPRSQEVNNLGVQRSGVAASGWRTWEQGSKSLLPCKTVPEAPDHNSLRQGRPGAGAGPDGQALARAAKVLGACLSCGPIASPALDLTLHLPL